MFEWLTRKLRRISPPTIRTLEDLIAALKSGAIRPRVHGGREHQVLDPFAETGLSPLERKKVLHRSFGYPAGIYMYVHRACADPYLAHLRTDNRGVFEPRTQDWSSADLIGRYPDITHCDHCGSEFQPNDDRYTAYWVVPLEDLRLFASGDI
jgi:hypothetical protein